MNSTSKCNFEVQREVSCVKMRTSPTPYQRSTHANLHTTIPDICLIENGHYQTEIAESMGVHKSTISREINRNTGGRGYRPNQALRK